jgi:hypothetical protein
MDDNLPRTGSTTSIDDSGISVTPPNRPNSSQTQQDDQAAAVSAGMVKEMERQQIAQTESYLEEVGKLPELEPELEKAGVQQISGEVQIPPAVSQMGVSQAGPTAPVSGQVTVNLPITDDQVFKGLHADVFDAFRWLAEWSMRRLRMAHLALKKVGGKIVRIPTK